MPQRWSDFTSAFDGMADMMAPAAGLVLVENDPKPTFHLISI
jgi:hypothetical protein